MTRVVYDVIFIVPVSIVPMTYPHYHEMVVSYYSIFLVPCVPFLCSVGSMFLVPVYWFVSSFIHWLFMSYRWSVPSEISGGN
jgi:hypothetical protein